MKRVFFLGAGATKADFPQAPLNEKLLKEVLKLNIPQAVKAKDIVEDFIRKFFYSPELGEYPRIEDVLSFLDSNLLYQRFYCKGYGYEELFKVRTSLVYLIGQLFENTLKNSPKGVTKKFCEILTKEDIVISTNYDILINNVLGQDRSNINYGEKIRGSGSFSESYTLFGDEETVISFYKHENRRDLNRGAIELLKLHGSLNFLYCPKCREVDITIGPEGIVYCMRKNFEVQCINPNCTGRYTDLIVAPTYYKSYDNPFLKGIWLRAERAISSADELIFIGYSLPDADIEIRCLLLRGIARNSSKPRIVVVDIDTSGRVKKQYLKLFGEVRYFDCGFEGYLNEQRF